MDSMMSRTDGILAIDQGTTNTKAVFVVPTGQVVARSSHPLPIRYPQPAWVEQDSNVLWESVQSAMRACLAQIEGAEVRAVAVTNQRESVLVWERKTGEPLGPCIT